MQKHKNNAFTLVELIVVITILAILGTIAFISLQGYSAQSRDSVRITDISSMKTSLELFQLDAGKYPVPTDSFSVTYSGSEVWTQGIFGDSTFKNVESLDKIPTDPLDDRKYAYSVTKTRQEYQISGVMEGDDLVFVGVNAGDKEAIAVVTGNYNGNVLKTLSGTTCEILSVPSIISSQVETTTELTTILSAEGLVYNGKNNLPSNFRASKYNADGGFSFTSNKLIAYSDTGSCAALYDGEDSTARTTLLTNLQIAYSGTILANAGGIKNIVNVDLNDSNAVNLFASSLVNNSLGGDVILSSSSNVDSNGGGVEVCNSGMGWDGSSCNVATECATGIEYITLSNGQSWSCMNLGATTVWDGSTQPTNCGGSVTTSCNSGLTWIGDIYQWGKSDNSYTYPWEPANDIWGDVTDSPLGTNISTRQGPCLSGWHVPAEEEWQSACDTILGTTCTNGMAYNSLIATTLKLPFAGRADPGSSNRYYDYQSIYGYYHTSSVLNTTNSIFFSFNGSNITTTNNISKNYSFSVRCLKD